MKRMVLAAVLLIACGLGSAAGAQNLPAPEKARDIERLLRLMKAAELGEQVAEQLMPEAMSLFEAGLSELAAPKRAQARRILEEEVRREFAAGKVIALVVPIYDKYLTAEEVKALIAFWESPAGVKFAAVQPQLVREAGEVSNRLAEVAAKRATQRMAEEGVFDPPPAPRPARRAPARRRP